MSQKIEHSKIFLWLEKLSLSQKGFVTLISKYYKKLKNTMSINITGMGINVYIFAKLALTFHVWVDPSTPRSEKRNSLISLLGTTISLTQPSFAIISFCHSWLHQFIARSFHSIRLMKRWNNKLCFLFREKALRTYPCQRWHQIIALHIRNLLIEKRQTGDVETREIEQSSQHWCQNHHAPFFKCFLLQQSQK